MALEVFLTRSPSGSLMPASPDDAERLAVVKGGAIVRASISQPRNVRFHRKGFALLKLAFDMWAETAPSAQYRGQDVRPEFDRFRKDLTILAGFYRPVFSVRGDVRLEAESLSFASMSEARFAEVYSALLDTILAKVLTTIDRDELERAVERVMGFA